jgi:predicted aspartyl protease
LDTGAFHNFITQESAERMELHLGELKAPIEVHFADGVPHPTTLQAKEVPLQLGNWRGKVDLLVSTLHTFTTKVCTHIKPGWKWNYYVVVV